MKVNLLVFFCIIAQISGQLIFKYVASRINGLTDIFAEKFTFGIFLAALSMYGLSVMLWVEALRYMDISRLYMFFALGFVLIPIGAHLLYKEAITPQQIAGSILIVGGIVVANYR